MHCKSYSHFFSKKFQYICVSLNVNFNESLTNDIVSFEQLGPEFFLEIYAQVSVFLQHPVRNRCFVHVSKQNKLLMTLMWLRTYHQYSVLVNVFNFAIQRISEIVHSVSPILHDTKCCLAIRNRMAMDKRRLAGITLCSQG